MKRFLKIFVPVLLIVAIILSTGWYFLEYDPDFTRDLLVHQARKAEERGDHSLSAWLYDLAYRHAGNDSQVALEMAEQYKAAGNYTKAEYTLSNAIANGGSVELYIALCQTYLEQNKLLDAVTMLDRVSDPVIGEQLDQLRPEAPTATPDAGYYDQYIQVSLQADSGTIYYTTDGNYPSTKDEPYSAPISLSGGETTIMALTVGENGLVSPLQVYSYTIAGVIEEVTLTDPAIDRVVRETLQVSSDHVLYSNELWSITTLMIPADAQTLEDLKWMPFLEQLVIRGHEGFQTLSPLAELTQLQELVIADCPVSASDVETIAGLTELTALTLSDCSLSGIKPLSTLTKLTYLDLSDNAIRDLSALEPMTLLTYLDLRHNTVDDATILGGLSKLTELYLSYNALTSAAPLAGCSELMVLELGHNQLTTTEGLGQFQALRTLDLSYNQLTEVSSLADLPVLGDLNISHNALTDIQALSKLEGLLMLDLSYNQVTSLPAFAKTHGLVRIDGTSNQITSLEPLRDLPNLNFVIMDKNAGLSSVAPLAKCPALVEVSVLDTNVTDVSPLTSQNQSVIVKYSPV